MFSKKKEDVKMNALIIRYKIIVLSAMILVGMGIKAQGAPTCTPCQAAAAARLSARDAAAAALSVAASVAKSMELDTSDSQVRAPREELATCSLCDSTVKPLNLCCIKQQLQRLVDNQAVCCAVINAKLDDQEEEAEKCCKKVRHELDEIESTLGDVENSAIAIPNCGQVATIVDVVNNTNIDVISWLKSIYLLLFQVYQCACEPCIE